jgi:hypothetical protein
MTGGMTLEQKTDVGRLLFEAQIAAEAAAMGCEAIGRAAEGWRDKAKVAGVLRLITQTADALEDLHNELEPHISAEDASAGPTVSERLELAEARLEITEAALEFYADPINWNARRGKPAAVEDAGKRARQALDDGEDED